MRLGLLVVFLVVVLPAFLTRSLSLDAQPVVQSGLAIIVHPSNPVDKMDKIEVKICYLRVVSGNWPATKDPLRPADYSPYLPVKEMFLQKILRLTNQQMMAYFKQKEASKSLSVPPAFATEEEVVNYVATNKGAIGYVSVEAIAKASLKVKVILEIK
jgi:ABC-type phosphate transport system substrate-binding protein